MKFSRDNSQDNYVMASTKAWRGTKTKNAYECCKCWRAFQRVDVKEAVHCRLGRTLRWPCMTWQVLGGHHVAAVSFLDNPGSCISVTRVCFEAVFSVLALHSIILIVVPRQTALLRQVPWPGYWSVESVLVRHWATGIAMSPRPLNFV